MENKEKSIRLSTVLLIVIIIIMAICIYQMYKKIESLSSNNNTTKEAQNVVESNTTSNQEQELEINNTISNQENEIEEDIQTSSEEVNTNGYTYKVNNVRICFYPEACILYWGDWTEYLVGTYFVINDEIVSCTFTEYHNNEEVYRALTAGSCAFRYSNDNGKMTLKTIDKTDTDPTFELDTNQKYDKKNVSLGLDIGDILEGSLGVPN